MASRWTAAAGAMVFSTVALAVPSSSGPLWFDAITGLRELSWGAQGVELQLARSLPAYGWAMLILAILVVVGFTYARLTGPTWARGVLALLRALALLLLVLLACGPQLVKQNERVDRDWVVLMADRSASMAVADVEREGGQRTTRDEQLRSVLRGASRELGDIASKRNVLPLGFDASVFDIASSATKDDAGPTARFAINLGEPAGKRTALGTSLAQALQRVAARPVAGLVLLSDGRSFDAPSRELINELVERQIPIYPIALGSAQGVPDLAITRVDAPQSAFVGDLLPIRVDVEALGASGGTPQRGTVQLLDESGRVVVERSLDALDESVDGGGGGKGSSTGGASRRLTLTVRPEDLQGAGDGTPAPATTTNPSGEGTISVRDWTVKLVAEGPDLTSENNAQGMKVELVDRPIRVLYVDGYPRWEYRYVKNLLLREKLIRSTTMLLSAEKRFIQEGTDRIESLPRNPTEWAAFDVVMLGDVRPGLFSEDQLRALREAIAERGVGLLWIGGPSFTPTAWRGTLMADLLPFALGATDSMNSIMGGGNVEVAIGPVLMEPGPAAPAYGLLQLGEFTGAASWPATLTDAQLGWPKFQWSQAIEPGSLKPASEVLALARGVSGTAVSSETTPLIVTMRYGGGRSVYVGTDETWRYRYGRGETLTERLWIPMVRLLARGSLGRTGKPALLEASPERALVNQPVRVVVRLLDQSLLDQKPASVRTRVARLRDGATQSGPNGGEELVLSPEGAGGSGGGTGADGLGGIATYAGLWVPGAPGLFAITPTEPILSGFGLTARVLAQAPEDEMRRPQTDHNALEQLAAATGGRMLKPEELAIIGQLLPNREVRTLGTPQVETIWDKPWALIALLMLVALEWIGRRMIKLS